jgi:Ca-activated chloride channel family protein
VSLASPWFLFALALVPLVAAFAVWIDRRRARYSVAFTNLELLEAVAEQRRRPLRRWIPLLLLLLALASASAALARPRATVRTAKGHATIVLLVDVSGSMRSDDVKPTRLGAAQSAMHSFLDKMPKSVKIGLVSFSTEPNVLVPPTTDRSQMDEGIDLLEPEAGTAIGDGLAVAVDVAKSADGNVARVNGEKAPAAIVLLSDGAQTRGVLSPLQGADRAKVAGIPVYTIALGTVDGTLTLPPGFAFPFQSRIHVRPDPAILRAISAATGGVSYQAHTASRANSIYRSLSTRLGTEVSKREVSSWFTGIAAALLLGALGAGVALGPRL